MLTPDMKRIIEEQRLGFVATAAADGTPNVSPKSTFVVLDDVTIAFGEIRSPGTIRNLRDNARIEVNFVESDAMYVRCKSLRARRHHLPQAPAAGAPALGIRQSQAVDEMRVPYRSHNAL